MLWSAPRGQVKLGTRTLRECGRSSATRSCGPSTTDAALSICGTTSEARKRWRLIGPTIATPYAKPCTAAAPSPTFARCRNGASRQTSARCFSGIADPLNGSLTRSNTSEPSLPDTKSATETTSPSSRWPPPGFGCDLGATGHQGAGSLQSATYTKNAVKFRSIALILCHIGQVPGLGILGRL